LFGLIFFVFCLIKAKQDRDGDHIRFVPVPILKSPVKKLLASRAPLPFALSSCIALLFSVFGGGFSGLPADDVPFPSPPLISAAEYRAHAEYQRHFSFSPLGRNGFDEDAYLHYDMGVDGLITNAAAGGLNDADLPAIPPFPLEDLMEFLGNRGSAGAVLGIGDMGIVEFVPVLLALLLSIPALSGGGRKGKKKGPDIYNDKRIAA
jgi:hypothetical protein